MSDYVRLSEDDRLEIAERRAPGIARDVEAASGRFFSLADWESLEAQAVAALNRVLLDLEVPG